MQFLLRGVAGQRPSPDDGGSPKEAHDGSAPLRGQGERRHWHAPCVLAWVRCGRCASARASLMGAEGSTAPAQQGQLDAGKLHRGVRLRQALHLASVNQVDDQHQFGLGHAASPRRCRRPAPPSCPRMLSGAAASTRSPSRRISTWSSATRVGGSRAAGPRRARNRKRSARSDLPRPRRPAQQRSPPAERHAGAVHELSCVGQAAALPWRPWHPPPAGAL